MTTPQVTAVVVTYQTGPRLRDCLYALRADPQVEAVVIVDNGNPLALEAWLDRITANTDKFSLLRPGANLGFGRAVNLGARAVVTSHMLVINPDAVLRWRSVEAMQETAAGLGDPWIVGGRIFDLTGREERGGRRRELTLWRAITRIFGVNTWTLEHDPPPAGPVAMPVISGAFFLTSVASFWQLAGFDEAYFMHVEDIDLCRRCREAGGSVMYDPRAGVLHYGATSQVSSRTVAQHKADSLVHYFRHYARNPAEKLLVVVLAPLIRAATLFRSA